MITEEQYKAIEPWDYTGDINLEYGGLFIKYEPENVQYDYLELVEVTDLTSATGADGLQLIEQKSVWGFADKDKVRNALSCVGQTAKDLRGLGKKAIILQLAYALNAYGYSEVSSDFISDGSIVIVLAEHYTGDKRSWDGWQVDRVESVKLHKDYDDDLWQYVVSVWLD